MLFQPFRIFLLLEWKKEEGGKKTVCHHNIITNNYHNKKKLFTGRTLDTIKLYTVKNANYHRNDSTNHVIHSVISIELISNAINVSTKDLLTHTHHHWFYIKSWLSVCKLIPANEGEIFCIKSRKINKESTKRGTGNSLTVIISHWHIFPAVYFVKRVQSFKHPIKPDILYIA